MFGFFFGVYCDGFIVYNQCVFGEIYVLWEVVVVRIMLEQIGQYFGRGEVVDGDDGVVVLGFKKVMKYQVFNVFKFVNVNFIYGFFL